MMNCWLLGGFTRALRLMDAYMLQRERFAAELDSGIEGLSARLAALPSCCQRPEACLRPHIPFARRTAGSPARPTERVFRDQFVLCYPTLSTAVRVIYKASILQERLDLAALSAVRERFGESRFQR